MVFFDSTTSVEEHFKSLKNLTTRRVLYMTSQKMAASGYKKILNVTPLKKHWGIDCCIAARAKISICTLPPSGREIPRSAEKSCPSSAAPAE